jgi:rubrerythrin
MQEEITLSDVDTDGAVREAAEEAYADTRLGFLKTTGVGVGALAGGGAVLGALAPGAFATGAPPKSFGKGDIGILNFALTLEYLEAAFYNQATANLTAQLDARTAKFLKVVTLDENAHVKALRKALGHKAVKKPKFNFKTATTDVATFKATAQALENTGVHAYLGQVGNVKSKKVLAAAGSIVTIEARHASVINEINGASITPDGPFDKPFTAAKVLAAVKKTGFIVG